MPSDQTARRTGRHGSIRIPDQLQQAGRFDETPPVEAGGRPHRATEDEAPAAGVLGQLETERAHD